MITERNLLKFLNKTFPNITWNTEKYGSGLYKHIFVYVRRKLVYSLYVKRLFSEDTKKEIKREIPNMLRYHKVVKIVCKLKLTNNK